MANAKMPLWGDVKYNKEFLDQRSIMPALCAYKLEFVHPKTNKSMGFDIEPTGAIFKMFG
jgi:23S rRNA pseudouridine1911/1915/1917 synthase